MRCAGIHCGDCGHHQGGRRPGGVLAGLAVIVIVIAASIKTHGRLVADALVIGGWALAGVAALSVTGLAAWRIRRGRQATPAPVLTRPVRPARSPAESTARGGLAHDPQGAGAGRTAPRGHRDGDLYALSKEDWAVVEGRAPEGGDQL